MTFEAPKHPEWKRFEDNITTEWVDHPEHDLYLYNELEPLGGIDVRTTRGRRQFHKAIKALRKKLGIQFENVRDVGYRIIKPIEHLEAGDKRGQQAIRKILERLDIIISTRLDSLDEKIQGVIKHQIQTTQTLLHFMKKQRRTDLKLSHAITNQKLLVGSIIEECKPKEDPKNEPKH